MEVKMQRFCVRIILCVAFAGWHATQAGADDAKVKVEKLDPSSTVTTSLQNSDPSCAVIYQDGNYYRICPNIVSPEIMAIVKAQK